MQRTDTVKTAVARLVLMSLCISMLPAAPGSASAAWTLEDVIERTPLHESQLDRLRAGGIVSTPIIEAAERELAVAVACLVVDSVEDPLESFLGPKPILPAEHMRESGVIRSERDWDGLDRSTLSLQHARELQRYLTARPGFLLNLSREEVSELDGIGDEGAAAAVRRAIHELLEDRYRGYRDRGLAGIAEYARGKDEIVAPGELLERSLESATGLEAFLPVFERAWHDYPKSDFKARDDTFFWANLEVDDRPAWLLAHRYAGDQVVGQRTFYVSHFFDAGTTIVGWVPVREGRVFFLTNRLWLDRLSGFGASIKRRLGRRLLSNQMTERLEDTHLCRSAP